MIEVRAEVLFFGIELVRDALLQVRQQPILGVVDVNGLEPGDALAGRTGTWPGKRAHELGLPNATAAVEQDRAGLAILPYLLDSLEYLMLFLVSPDITREGGCIGHFMTPTAALRR